MRAFVESRPWFLAIRSGDAAGPYLGDYRRSFVRVDSARLYDLARGSGGRTHELSVMPDRAGGGVYGFEFADACIATRLP